MYKKEFVSAVSEKTGFQQKDVKLFLDASISVLEDTLSKKENVSILGLGTFSVSERAERKGINPRTKEEIVIPASSYPKFKACKSLKDAVN